ncbi:hypothetical protein RHMOL_Rhmol01G0323300 [Rhododendron molle]|uniref:Uncharacterized protein n=1 Tax=Rhododendron molle TaxID=49168 RepID=A0ACC0Q7Q1_RHOML|nr:hypothetical protein RHMOL_Rhmol01G0323300 [Rhododendron molle]
MIKLSPSLGKDNLGLPVDQACLLAVYNFWVVLLASICCRCLIGNDGGGGSFVNCFTRVWFSTFQLYTYLFSPDCKIFMEMVQEVAKSQRTKDENKDASAAAGLLEKLSVEDKKSEEKAKDGRSLEAKEESEIEPGKTDTGSKGEEPVSST